MGLGKRAVVRLALRRLLRRHTDHEGREKLKTILADPRRLDDAVDFLIEFHQDREEPTTGPTDKQTMGYFQNIVEWLSENWFEIVKLLLMLFMILDVPEKPESGAKPTKAT